MSRIEDREKCLVEYLRGGLTLAEMAQRFNLPYRTVCRWSAEGQWRKLRALQKPFVSADVLRTLRAQMELQIRGMGCGTRATSEEIENLAKLCKSFDAVSRALLPDASTIVRGCEAFCEYVTAHLPQDQVEVIADALKRFTDDLEQKAGN